MFNDLTDVFAGLSDTQVTIFQATLRIASKRRWTVERTQTEITIRSGSSDVGQRVYALADKAKARGRDWLQYLGIAIAALSLLLGIATTELQYLAWQHPKAVKAPPAPRQTPVRERLCLRGLSREQIEELATAIAGEREPLTPERGHGLRDRGSGPPERGSRPPDRGPDPPRPRPDPRSLADDF